MIARLETQRSWVRNHFTTNASELYETFGGKMDLIENILKSKWVDKSETYKLQCLGVALGDSLIQDLGFRWIEIEDEFGVDPALKLSNTSLILFPLTMISKRIENNQEIDIYALYNGIKDHVLKVKDKVDKK